MINTGEMLSKAMIVIVSLNSKQYSRLIALYSSQQHKYWYSKFIILSYVIVIEKKCNLRKLALNKTRIIEFLTLMIQAVSCNSKN